MLKRLEPCDLMSIQEVAGRLDVTERTVYKYVKEKKIRAIRIGRLLRISVDDYLTFVFGQAFDSLKETHEKLTELQREFLSIH